MKRNILIALVILQSTILNLPSAFASFPIIGSSLVCQGQTGVTYSVPGFGDIGCIWNYSGTGFSIVAGAGSNSITADFSDSATSGILTVTVCSHCGCYFPLSTLAVTVIPFPSAPTDGTNVPSLTQIIWNWNTASGATGYKWNTTNNYVTATDMGTATTKTETGLTPGTLYTRFVWAYNNCGNSTATTLIQTTLSLYIGANYGGGIIFYIDGTGRKGLIAAASDQSTGAQWGCFGTLIGGTGTAIGTGQANTTAIVNGCNDAGIAAQICNDLVLNGYSDWFLPSKDELNQMYLQKSVIGGFTIGNYWSSSEETMAFAWAEGMFYGNMFNDSKGTPNYVRAARAFSEPGWSCGSSITINHVAGAVAPVNKTVTYGTVTNIPGTPAKCWITSNLGADHQATAVNDATEASAGWYWQFNRMQGYKHDGTTRTPNTTWITPIIEDLDWQAANDPCALELGSGWRIPTYTEWSNVITAGGWTNWNDPWNSALKLHAAGVLDYYDGHLSVRGSFGTSWSSTQYSSDHGWELRFSSGDCYMGNDLKVYGFSLRCLRD